MGLFDPSESDNEDKKKPRFRQDLMVLYIVLGGVILYLLIEWLS